MPIVNVLNAMEQDTLKWLKAIVSSRELVYNTVSIVNAVL